MKLIKFIALPILDSLLLYSAAVIFKVNVGQIDGQPQWVVWAFTALVVMLISFVLMTSFSFLLAVLMGVLKESLNWNDEFDTYSVGS